MRLIFVSIVALSVMAFSISGYTNPKWYRGIISEISPHGEDGGFYFKYVGLGLEGCFDEKVYFSSEFMSENRLRNSWAMALSGYSTFSKVGVVVDKTDLLDGKCMARSMEVRK